MKPDDDFSLHWLTQVLHDTSKLDSPDSSPQGQWSSPQDEAEALLTKFSRILSSHQDTPPAVLTWLAKYNCPKIQERLAEHPNTPAQTLEELASSDRPHVRAAVGDNPNVTGEILKRLACDEHVDVRFSLAENCNLDQEILQILTHDENPFVACRARRSLELRKGGPVELEQSQRLRVLLVDDDDVTRMLLALALKDDPLVKVIGQATSGATAIQMARTLNPDVILMDISMPNMNGIVSTSFIKKEMPHTRIIMVTAHDRLEEIVGAFGHGAEGYHLKTSSKQDLGKAIRVVASGSLWLDPGIVSTVLRELSKRSTPLVQNQYPSISTQKSALSDPVQALMQVVEEYVTNKMYGKARQICQSAVTLSEQLYGDSPSTTAALNRLAELYFIEQEYGPSESTYLHLIELQSKLCDLDDPSLDSYLRVLTDLYTFRGNNQQAELFASWHLRIREKQADQSKLDEAKHRLSDILHNKPAQSENHKS